MHGKDAHLVTLVERNSRLALIGKVANKKADTVAEKMSELLQRVDTVHTITLDNGGEFAIHAQVTATSGATVYSANPYASYQRGTHENTNGLIRRHWPKRTNLGELDESAISD